MTIERTHSPKYWRNRAEEMRAKADNCGRGQTRDTLLRAAAAYDQLAKSATRNHSVSPEHHSGSISKSQDD
jgi:hypothetical protein